MRLPTTSLVLVTSLLVLGAAGCGSDDGADAPAGTAPPTRTPTPLPTLRPPSGPPSKPTEAFTKTRLSGVVVEGPAGCTELESDVGVRWSLLGPLAEDLGVGQPVVVVGRSRPEVPGSACTGAPFAVQSVEQT